MGDAGIDSINLLKMDIEGAEKEIFKCCPWINKVNVLAIELHDRLYGGCTQAVRDACQGFAIEERGEITFFFAQQIKQDIDYSADALADRSFPARSPAA